MGDALYLENARKYIRENLTARNPRLDLGRCGITDLNELPELFECSHLEELILSSEWRKDGADCKSVNSGKSNQLTAPIPDAVAQLNDLRVLIAGDVKKRGWKRVDVRAIGNLRQLEYLDLRRCGTIRDVRFLDELTGLQTLLLSDNEIEDVSFLTHMPQLKVLDLDRNYLIDIKAIGQCTSLERLSLNGNGLCDISTLGQLSRLRVLELNCNYIESVEPLRGLHNLTELQLSANKLTDITPLTMLKKLERLYCSQNSITDIGVVAEFPHLRMMDFRGNNIGGKAIEELVRPYV